MIFYRKWSLNCQLIENVEELVGETNLHQVNSYLRLVSDPVAGYIIHKT